MIKILFKLLLLSCLYIVPQITFAQANVFNFNTGTVTAPTQFSFAPALTDNSVGYLGQVFGTVGTVLHGTSGQMLGMLFLIFNIGVLSLASVFLTYTIVMTIITAAHEGEFLGRKYNTAWIALRTVIGLGLLVPSPTTGYSTVQVIVMWVVLQGVGFADMAWQQALGYINSGGQVYTPPTTQTSEMVNLVGTILASQVCMYNAQKVAKDNQQLQSQLQKEKGTTTTNGTTTSPTYTQEFQPFFTYAMTPTGTANLVVRFPSIPYQVMGKQDNGCGEIIIGSNSNAQASSSANITAEAAFQSNIGSLGADTKTQTIKSAIRQIILDLQPYAKTLGSEETPPSNFDDQLQSAIIGGAADWINITLPIRSSGTSLGDLLMTDFMSTAAQEGWIMAGRYYYALGNINRQIADATTVAVSISQPPAGFSSAGLGDPGKYIDFSGDPGTVIQKANMTNLTTYNDNQLSSLVSDLSTAYTQTNLAATQAKAVDQAYQVNLNLGSAGVLGFLLDPIGSVLLTTIAELTTAVGDPITALMTIGYLFMGLSATMWLLATVALFGAGTAASVLSSINSVGYGLQDAILAFIPTFTVFILGFFILGATFAFYVPLIPFIIYVFAAVGWLIAVIEAMVAAPLVALGITHPEGHDLLGKGEQAIMLLLSVFLRPILMVIGLFAGMILSRVILRYLNSGFFGMVFDVGGYNSISWVAPGFTLFTFMAMLSIYTMLLLSIINQCFSLIYVVPDRVMRWLGVTEQTSGVAEALQAAKGGFEQAVGGIKETGGAVAQAGGPVAKERLAIAAQKKAAKAKGGGATQG